ncbi:family 20 glycosylhydrolase [Streptomyces sp. V4-01]|uniref:beta-N-acetylhexosaminidase n=1 Tax=Actinacidiphila polyblastidii TaxID=3110430 RepID=A0ABU7PLA2_9ACTN|nr:family 20 glycosylhydrolase [Streptomyces sp. V4-01]
MTGVQVLAGPPSAQAVTGSTMGGIVPQPVTVQPDTTVAYPLTASTAIHTDAASGAAAQIGAALAAVLRPSTGYALPVSSTTTTPASGISLLLSGAPASVGAQGYQLDVTATQVVIRAQQPAGLFAGVQTLRQILPPQIEAASVQPGPWSVPGGHILDYPRYGYRGAMLDVARHFFTVAQVERYIDQLSQYKIDYLHLHLTDDQGWRIAVNGWPDLTAIGGATGVGGRSGGFYTQADYQALVAYAAARYVTVVPEIDMPGHVGAALSSYPSLNCDGRSAPVYTGTEVGQSSLCMTQLPAAESFIDAVIGQLAALTPGPYLSIGGDEAHSTSASDYATYMTWAQQDVVRHGKKAIGWNQIVGSTLQPSTIAEDWDTSGSDPALAAAASKGTGLIMAPANRAYIDQKYTASTVVGLTWAGRTDVRTTYGWDPGGYLSGAPASAVAGVEAPLWSETATSTQDIDYLAFPRLPVVAELGWSPQSGHDVTAFSQRLAAQGPRWDVQGTRYYHSGQIAWPVGATGPTGPITSQEGSTCVDVTGGSAANGTPVEIRTCGGGSGQQWTIASDGTVRALGKCLDVASGGTAAGTPVQIYDCNGTAAQKWTQRNGTLLNPQSGRCLNVSTGTPADGGALQIANCADVRAQWFAPPAGTAGTGPSGPVTSKIAGKCMDVTGGTSLDATPVALYDCNGTPAQRWVIGDDGTLRSLGKCLAAAGGATAGGTKVQLATCDGTAGQQWQWNAGGGPGISGTASGLCLDDPAGSTANGTQLQLYACNGSTAQNWQAP